MHMAPASTRLQPQSPQVAALPATFISALQRWHDIGPTKSERGRVPGASARHWLAAGTRRSSA
jgi:hypothetical protein